MTLHVVTSNSIITHYTGRNNLVKLYTYLEGHFII
jgi:hypothetical protein